MALPMNSLLSGKQGLRVICSSLKHPHHVNLFTSSQPTSKTRKAGLALLSAAVGTSAVVVYSLNESVKASGHELQPTALPWSHYGFLQSLDHASVRRGYEVYKQVCAACHSMRFMAYRRLVNVTHTEEEAKKEAAEIMVKDGPNEDGEMFDRPGKLFDTFSNPYANEQAARVANNGALPPDLSYIVNARGGHEDYIFYLLTGYRDPPAGIKMAEGQYYNPYFPGGAIGMAQALYNEIFEYEDGTPATQSQLAKDVSTFLKWSGEPEFDTRRLFIIKATVVCGLMFSFVVYYKRHLWSVMKSRKIFFVPPKK